MAMSKKKKQPLRDAKGRYLPDPTSPYHAPHGHRQRSLDCLCDACLETRCRMDDGIFMRRYVNVGGRSIEAVEFRTRPCYLADVKDW
jgi:hypothetical protein